jgi:hypothetical protein
MEEAFVCRKLGKYSDGFSILKDCAEKGDAVACLHIAFAYKYGGWGIFENYAVTQDYYRTARKLGNNFIEMYRYMRRNTNNEVLSEKDILYHNIIFSLHLLVNECIEEAIRLNDEIAQIIILEKTTSYQLLVKREKLLKFNLCNAYISTRLSRVAIFEFERLHLLDNGTSQGCFYFGVDMLIECYCAYGNIERLCKIFCGFDAIRILMDKCEVLSRNKVCKYLIGKSFAFNVGPRFDKLQFNIQYYIKIRARVQRTVIWWLLCAKKMFFIKDLAKIIGKMIWETRETEPFLYDCRQVNLPSKKIKQYKIY